MSHVVTALLGVIVGVLLGGGVQLFVAWRQRVWESRRAARLLFGDAWLAIVAIRSMANLGVWWRDESGPRLDDWNRYREALAGAMDGPAWMTVDGAFHRVANLETWRKVGLDASDQEDDAREAVDQLHEALTLLMQEGYKGKELRKVEHELGAIRDDPWADDDEPQATPESES